MTHHPSGAMRPLALISLVLLAPLMSATPSSPVVELTTDSAEYFLVDPVLPPQHRVFMTLRNLGPGAIELADSAPFVIFDDAGDRVFYPSGVSTVATLAEGETYGGVWEFSRECQAGLPSCAALTATPGEYRALWYYDTPAASEQEISVGFAIRPVRR